MWPVVRYDNPPVRYNLLGHVAAMLENTRILDSAFAVTDNTGDYLMTSGAHALKPLHKFVDSHFPKDCQVA